MLQTNKLMLHSLLKESPVCLSSEPLETTAWLLLKPLFFITRVSSNNRPK